jgi:hypothetical protein
MQTFMRMVLSLGAAGLGVLTAVAQPPEGEIRTRQAPPGRYGGGPDGRQPPGGPPRWELGRLIPPPIEDELNLTEDQQKQLHDLEKEVRDRVMKMLTSEQKDKLKRLQRRGGPPGGHGESPDRRRPPRGEGPPDRDGPPGRREPPNRPEPPDGRQSLQDVKSQAIQWFATWQSGLKEAQRSGRPILLVSAAPHCAGVPGVW